MTGLEKMQSQILDEAQKNADEILEEAKKEAVEIREAAQEGRGKESSAGKKQPYSGKIQDRGGAY